MQLPLLAVLLQKDLRRARRNPIPYLIHLCLPLVITGLLGFVFAGANQRAGGALGRIRLAIVDEDDSIVTRFLRGALSQERAAQHLDARFLDRDAALREVTNGTVAAVVVLPRGFTTNYLAGRDTVTLELVKNPAQQIHPAIVEELLSALVTGLNAVARNFRPDLAEWRDLVGSGRRPSAREIAAQVERTGLKLELVRARLDPLPVTYETEEKPDAAGDPATGPGSQAKHAGGGGGFNLFAYLLPGLAAMFLVFIADVAMRDLHREVRERTFERFCTLPQPPFLFVLGKVGFAFVIVALAAAILLGLGSVVFGFRWEQPFVVAALGLAFSLFAAGLMAALGGWIGGDRRAEVLNTVVAMGLGMAGGGAFPSQSLPSFLRERITPHLPTAWFIEAVRGSQSGGATGAIWPGALLKLAVLGLLLTVVAAWLLRRRLARGARVAG